MKNGKDNGLFREPYMEKGHAGKSLRAKGQYMLGNKLPILLIAVLASFYSNAQTTTSTTSLFDGTTLNGWKAV
ncbi:MAG: hypothetical protein HKM92_08520, partial [Arenibacter sp.]|nr:hypothetical protein [Arenibacter sp.]